MLRQMLIEEMDRETLEALYEETFRNFEEGTITEGRVVAIQKDRVVVDIGYKSEGMIATNQFIPEELRRVGSWRYDPSLYRTAGRSRWESFAVERKSRQDENMGGIGSCP